MEKTPEREGLRRLFAIILKRISRLRRLSNRDVARQMCIESRSFDRFVAGEVRLDVDRIFAFAKATNSDPVAIVAGLFLKNPELAQQCADNKLMMVHAICLEKLIERLGERLQKVDAATVILLYERLIEDCVRDLDEREARERDWLNRFPPDP